MALIDVEEVKELATKHIPKIAQGHPGIKMLLKFVGKTVRAVNHLDGRLKAVEARLPPVEGDPKVAPAEKSDA